MNLLLYETITYYICVLSLSCFNILILRTNGFIIHSKANSPHIDTRHKLIQDVWGLLNLNKKQMISTLFIYYSKYKYNLPLDYFFVAYYNIVVVFK
jgi:hypothetical protein